MQIHIHVGDQLFTATVEDTPAGRDLLAQLPQTIEMSDHGGVEKTGPLRALSALTDNRRADPDVGDLGYYAPGNDLVLYYGDQSYYDGIVILGRLDDQATSRLAQMAGDITATVTTPTHPDRPTPQPSHERTTHEVHPQRRSDRPGPRRLVHRRRPHRRHPQPRRPVRRRLRPRPLHPRRPHRLAPPPQGPDPLHHRRHRLRRPPRRRQSRRSAPATSSTSSPARSTGTAPPPIGSWPTSPSRRPTTRRRRDLARARHRQRVRNLRTATVSSGRPRQRDKSPTASASCPLAGPNSRGSSALPFEWKAMFAGLVSRCTIRIESMASTASSGSSTRVRTSSDSRGPALSRSSNVPPL